MRAAEEQIRTDRRDRMSTWIWIHLLLWSSGLRAEEKYMLPGGKCETTTKADIVLLVDDSGSISPADFENFRLVISNIVNIFTIGPDRVQIGLVQYTDSPETSWHLNMYQTKHSLLKAVDTLIHRGGGTMTGLALDYILQISFKSNVGMRADSQKIAILITDGESTDDVLRPSQNLKDVGIEVFAIGVKDARVSELNSIVSDPKEIHMFALWDSLVTPAIIDNFTTNICNSANKLGFVRLLDATSLCSGRLEVKSNQSWASVCEDDFDLQDAEVVCREVGCGAPSLLQGALYGELEAPTWNKEFQCEGNESALLDCRRSDSARDTCSPGKAVGLTCSEPVRLVGGVSRCAGTLQVKLGDWRPVSGSDWTLEAAAAACREMDCGPAVSTVMREFSSNRPTWKISSYCVLPGSALRECVSSLPWSPSILELTCSDPTFFIIRVMVLPLTLMLFIIVTHFILKVNYGGRENSM